jgi:hypothetical protein
LGEDIWEVGGVGWIGLKVEGLKFKVDFFNTEAIRILNSFT